MAAQRVQVVQSLWRPGLPRCSAAAGSRVSAPGHLDWARSEAPVVAVAAEEAVSVYCPPPWSGLQEALVWHPRTPAVAE